MSPFRQLLSPLLRRFRHSTSLESNENPKENNPPEDDNSTAADAGEGSSTEIQAKKQPLRRQESAAHVDLGKATFHHEKYASIAFQKTRY